MKSFTKMMIGAYQSSDYVIKCIEVILKCYERTRINEHYFRDAYTDIKVKSVQLGWFIF